jgi:hypothetical protein
MLLFEGRKQVCMIHFKKLCLIDENQVRALMFEANMLDDSFRKKVMQSGGYYIRLIIVKANLGAIRDIIYRSFTRPILISVGPFSMAFIISCTAC